MNFNVIPCKEEIFYKTYAALYVYSCLLTVVLSKFLNIAERPKLQLVFDHKLKKKYNIHIFN